MSMPASGKRAVLKVPSRTVSREKQASTSAPFGEEIFSHLLVQERRRSERSNRPFLLMTLKASERFDLAASRTGKTVVQALRAVMRGTDVLGWVQWPTAVGVIFPEIGAAAPVQAIETVRARIKRELAGRLNAETMAHFSVEFRAYPESSSDDSKSETGPTDSIFFPDLPRERRRRRLADWMKRIFDIMVCLPLLLGLAPLLLVVAGLVRLTSPGPVLFKQLRHGRLGKPFRMLKFRTMYVNASEGPHCEFVTRFIKEGGQAQTNGTTQLFKLTNDPRITPIGRILRKTSVDELPQLWNVLVGEMSLVGPRPPLPYELRHYAPWHRCRILEATPGITGLWQVTGRSRTTFDEMVRLDLRYARTRSLWTDLRILLRTPAAVLSGKGAC
jgi:lipopolysaccharide/colanic/teichoic acid biosynthesis glycosyltransferase